MRRTILDHTPDGLKRRLADLERQVMDLQRVRNPPPSSGPSTGAIEGRIFEFVGIAVPSGYDELDWTSASNSEALGSHVPTVVSGEPTSLLLPRGVWAVQMNHDSLNVNNSGPVANVTLNLYAWRNASHAFYDYLVFFDILHDLFLTPPDTERVQGDLVVPSDGAMKLSYGMQLISGNAADFPDFGNLIVGVYRLS